MAYEENIIPPYISPPCGKTPKPPANRLRTWPKSWSTTKRLLNKAKHILRHHLLPFLIYAFFAIVPKEGFSPNYFDKETKISVIWIVTDASDNSATCRFYNTAADNEPPTVTCVENQNRSTNLGSCTYTVQGDEFDPPFFGDNCPGATISNNFSGTATLSGAVFSKGSTTVTWTVTDAANNTATCSFDVTVEDNQSPIVTCPTPQSQYPADSGVCYARLSFAATATDNCAVDHIRYYIGNTQITFPYQFPVGTTIVTAIATDVSGNTSECSFSVLVVDTQTPSITCPAPLAQYTAEPGFCHRTLSFAATAVDNCGVAFIRYFINGNPIAFPYQFPVGSSIVTAVATDIHGNQSNPCSFVVNVIDNQAPQVQCPSQSSFNRNTASNSCTYTVVGTEFDLLGFSDNCAVTEVRYQLSGATTGIGFNSLNGVQLNAGTTSVRWFVSDAAGNVNQSCVLSVVVIDNVPPVFLNCVPRIFVPCPDDISPPDPLGLSVFDNCGAVTVSHFQDIWHGVGLVPGFCPDSIQRIYIAVDASYNVAYCTQMIVPRAPCGCRICQTNVPHFWVDLTGSCNDVWTSPNVARNGLCCGATSPERCISFSVRIGHGAVGFYVLMNGAAPPGWYFQVDCDTQVPLGQTLCIPPGEYKTITICKPGGNRNIYTIRAVCGVILPQGITTREDCEGVVSVSGVAPSSITYSNITGDYLHYLSSTSGQWTNPNGHSTVYFTPDALAPATIQYRVCGSIPGNPCATGGVICETLTLNVQPKVEITLEPQVLTFCENDPKPVVATVTPTGVYEFGWYDSGHNLLQTGGVFNPPGPGEFYVEAIHQQSTLPCSTGRLDFSLNYAECISCPDEQLHCSKDDVIVFNTLAEFVAAGATVNFPCEPLVSSFHLAEIVSDNRRCPEFLIYRYALQDICGNRDTCNVVIQINDFIRPTFNLPGDTIQCVADIVNATYNPNGTYPIDDITYPRPDYFLLRTMPPRDFRLDIINLWDNCTRPNDLIIEWEIDYGDNGTIDITGTGQISSFAPLPPHNGLYFPVGTNIVTYTVTDACGNSTTQSFTVIVRPRPEILDNY